MSKIQNLLIVFFVISILFFYANVLKHQAIFLTASQNRINDLNAAIYNSNILSQSFISKENNLTCIAIKFATYARKNNCKYSFILKNNSFTPAKIIYTQTFSANDIEDNKFHFFRFPPIHNIKGKKCEFSIFSSDATINNSLTVWYHKKNLYTLGTRIVNNNEVPGDLAFRLYNKLELKDLLNRIITNKPGMLNQKFLFPFTLLLFLFLSLKGIQLMIKKEAAEEKTTVDKLPSIENP